MKQPAESDLIEYRWLNMDNQCRTTEEALYRYASAFPTGIHRVASDGVLCPVIRAYGTRQYTVDDMKSLDERLPSS